MSLNLKDVADFATTFGVILGVPLALYGIDAWRREAMWKRRSKLCEEVLALCYEAKEIISYIRSPGGFGGEGETRKPQEGEPDDVRLKKNSAWVPIERHNKNLEKLSRLWTLSYRFRAQFGVEKTQGPLHRWRQFRPDRSLQSLTRCLPNDSRLPKGGYRAPRSLVTYRSR